MILLSLGSIITVLLNALFGMFFVIGGIVMIVIATPPRKKIKGQKLEKEPEEMQLCPQCNKKISKTFKICPYCRFSLKTRVSICPSCGKKIRSDFKLCPYCREKLKN